ncbi:MAG: transporter [Massilia sp.]|nr:transporter [Massilia sp.]
MLPLSANRATLGVLAITQLISWGSIYYAFSILAPSIQRDLGLGPAAIFGAFSWSLLVSGMLAPPVGILLDRIGGRVVMGTGSAVGAVGLTMLSQANSGIVYLAAWTVLGASMALVLYEAAFATINREFDLNPRKGISTLTLFAGFASTLFWPLTLKLDSMFGWRHTYLIYAVLQLALCLPLHACLTVRGRGAAVASLQANTVQSFTLREAIRHSVFWWLAAAFATNSFVFSALSVHLIPLLHRFGHPMATAVLFASLIGPLQVAGRIGEMLYAHRSRPRTVGLITFATLPIALAGLFLLGQREWVAAGFCLLYGLSNGLLTIVRGTIPQELFGRENYGAISGALSAPSLFFKALGPMVVAGVMAGEQPERLVVALLLWSSIVSLLAYWQAVRQARARPAPAALKPR